MSEGYPDRPLSLPCGICDGCRTTKAREWAVRCMHEYQTTGGGSWLTLTYDDKIAVPSDSLDYSHVQNFLKRLRKQLGPDRVSYYCAGEYGEERKRPHFHMCLFGFWPSDARSNGPVSERTLYTSRITEDLWGHGSVKIGRITMASASYTAQYTLKKVYGALAPDHYQGRNPERALMSLRPALGRRWFERHWRSTLDDVIATPDGSTVPLPRYYLKLLEKLSLKDAVRIGLTRAARAAEHPDEQTLYRLKIKEAVTAFRLSFKKRSL